MRITARVPMRIDLTGGTLDGYPLYIFEDGGLTEREIIDVGANIEAQVVRIPTGKQDYFPPIYGGILAIWFGLQDWTVESFPPMVSWSRS